MLKTSSTNLQSSLFFSLEDSLDQKHPLYILSNKVDWSLFESEFGKYYSANTGAPAKPIRLMVSLLILKHLRNLSDESVVEQWSENIYYQYFSGQTEFLAKTPCVPTELVMFRQRIGIEGCELILKESIRINGKDGDEPDISADTTVQEKNITYPTDNKLYRKIISKCKKIAREEKIELRQTYTHTLKRLYIDIRFGNHPQKKRIARASIRKVKTIAGRLVRELERKLAKGHDYSELINLFTQVLNQKRGDKNKIYSLHEPHVYCISKGKEHKKYEFGNKVSILYTQNTGVIVGALSFQNQYDGHTLPDALEQYERLKNLPAKNVFADRGYKGKSSIKSTMIHIPKPFSPKLNSYQQQKRRRAHKRRAAIEPVIGHLKRNHRLSRNFYKGDFGDAINVMLAAAAFNFKRMMNKWKLKNVQIGEKIQIIILWKLTLKRVF